MTRARAVALLPAVAFAALQAPAPSEDPRSRELLRYGCVSDLGEEAVTLFANGTVRLRRRGEETDELYLGELDPSELRAYRARLLQEDLREAESTRFGPGGDWIEQCTLELALSREEPRQSFRFGRYDSLGLNLSRVVAIAEELKAEAERRDGSRALPIGYRPQPGDVLERVDGTVYEVVAFTWDGAGLELRCVDQPTILYLPVSAVRDEFVAVVERAQ